MIPVLADPEHVVGVGGIIRILNGSDIQGGQLQRVRLPRKSIEIVQVIEYLRAFLIGREAWAQGNMMLIISGAFGLFRTDLVRAIGGYRATAIGEDFDLVARMHRHLLEKRVDYKIQFVPDPVCWTEAPSDLKSLGRQRARWQKGLLDTLMPNLDMLFRPTTDTVLVRPHHARAQFVQDAEGGFISCQPKLPLKLHRRHPRRLAGDEVRGPEPDAERRMTAFHDGAGADVPLTP